MRKILQRVGIVGVEVTSDPVRRLWAKAVATKTEVELTATLPKLHDAIRERIRRLRLIAKEIRPGGTDRRAA
jgi:hypothetical protein